MSAEPYTREEIERFRRLANHDCDVGIVPSEGRSCYAEDWASPCTGERRWLATVDAREALLREAMAAIKAATCTCSSCCAVKGLCENKKLVSKIWAALGGGEDR